MVRCIAHSLPLLLFLAVFCALLHPGQSNRQVPLVLTKGQISTFRRDGVIVIRGLLQGKELRDAIRAAKRIQRSQGLAQRIFYQLFPSYRNLKFQSWRKHKALERVAFDSAAPAICASLMGLEEGGTTSPRPVRLLKDAVLGFSAGDKGCGWHVDDKVFWPCEDCNVGKVDAGVNVWITLSTVTADEGGGLAVAPGTHMARGFAKRARDAIAERGPMSTCLLEALKPDCHEKMERLKKVYDLQPGDAIIHDRYIFHRADNFRDPIKSKKAGTKQRISLRYVPADATFYNFNGNERAVEAKQINTGDAISKGGEYYPQVFPNSLPEERMAKVKQDKDFVSLSALSRLLLSKITLSGRKN
mmetsp:Transcript_23969/g.57853  ORF Transcript_23969/g.57853 Transcript_23969/m.57853 type:complete len:358 (+) Transcript_23969:85-1158(+)